MDRSLIAPLLHSSDWPLFLGSESPSTGVSTSAWIFKHATWIRGVLVAIASIVTPLGLYESVEPDSKPGAYEFHYIADDGIFGKGTTIRNHTVTWSRQCGYFPRRCPGSATVIANISNSSDPDLSFIDTKVPQPKINLFLSGTSALGTSVSSIFDIDYRS